MPTASKNSIQSTKLIVSDLDKVSAWYCNVCGLEEILRVDEHMAGQRITQVLFKGDFKVGELSISPFMLLKYEGAQKSVNNEVMLVVGTDDIAAFLDRCRANAGAIVEDIRTVPEHGSKAAFGRPKVAIVRDCEGHLLEVIELMK